MAKYLARVVSEAREAAGRKPFHIAAAQPGEPSVDPSTIYRFEHEERWPRNPDLLINLYAADLDIEPLELWSRALELWREDEARALSAEDGVDRFSGELELEEEARGRRRAGQPRGE